jgi:hypothetical protein
LKESIADLDIDLFNSSWGSSAVVVPPPLKDVYEEYNTMISYGDQKGKAYINSIERFMKNIPADLFDTRKYCDQLTNGAHSLNIATINYCRNDTQKSKEVSGIDSQFNRLIRRVELDQALKNSVKCSDLTTPILNVEMKHLKPTPYLLEENANDFKKLLGQVSENDRKNLLERIRQRLLVLVQDSNSPEFELGKAITVKMIQPLSNPSFNGIMNNQSPTLPILNNPYITYMNNINQSPSQSPMMNWINLANTQSVMDRKCLNCGKISSMPINTSGIHMCNGNLCNLFRLFRILFG